MVDFIARKYRYADGVVYNPNVYDLFAIEGERYVRVGGAVVYKNKVIAYSGHAGYTMRFKDIEAYSNGYVWADTLKDVLPKIRPLLEKEYERKLK